MKKHHADPQTSGRENPPLRFCWRFYPAERVRIFDIEKRSLLFLVNGESMTESHQSDAMRRLVIFNDS